MALSINAPTLGLPSFLKPQVRLVPQIAGQVARAGTLALLGYTGYQAYAHSGFSFDSFSLLQNALLLGSPVLAANFNKSGAENLVTRALWKPIQKEKLNDADQVLNKGVLNSPSAQAALEKDFPGSLGKFEAYLNAMKNQALTSGLIYAGLGVGLTVYYLNQF